MTNKLRNAIRQAVYYRLGYCDLSKDVLDTIAYSDLSNMEYDEITFMADTLYLFLEENGKRFTDYVFDDVLRLYYTGYDYAGERYTTGYSGAVGNYWNNGPEFRICL